MSTATEATPRPVGEKTVDLATRLVGQPYVGRHRRRNLVYVTLAALLAEATR